MTKVPKISIIDPLMDHFLASNCFTDRSFPLTCKRYTQQGNTDLHDHDFYELAIILKGRGLHFTAAEKYPIQAGDVFLLRRNMAHGYIDEDESIALANILFDPRRLRLPLDHLADVPGYQALFRVEPSLRQSNRFQHRLHLPPDALAEAAGMIARLENEITRKAPGYRFSAVVHLMTLIDFLSRRYFKTTPADKRPLRKMSEILSYIEAHYQEPIRIDQLTRLAGMSKSSLTRNFQAIMNCSPIDHIIRMRIQRAAELLRRPGVRIAEAAQECGFTDSNYFTRQFHKIIGVSPREYRIPARHVRTRNHVSIK